MTCHYVTATGDWEILDEETPFLEGKPVHRMSETLVFAPRPSRDTASLYTHCLRAIDLTLKKFGPHGLPLLGTGDWNDGLDMAGYRNRGESVWLGFFLHDILIRFSDLAAEKEGESRKKDLLDKAKTLREALDTMWKEDRYVRFITDEGRALARVNALTASWSIISGVADSDKGWRAMATALEKLEKEEMVLLFSPPYTENDDFYPGRLADYPPGVRENGGQYSHGVSWMVDALLLLAKQAQENGDNKSASEYKTKAVELWKKISPLSHLPPERLSLYGLPPHQQAADIYFGPGYEGRGGWSWYTGAAGRMLYTAFALFGLRMEEGELIKSEDLYEARGSLKMERISHHLSEKEDLV
jgi:cyclic beta-1,2-glucan synthetase